jgi:hypothetical protein
VACLTPYQVRANCSTSAFKLHDLYLHSSNGKKWRKEGGGGKWGMVVGRGRKNG